VTVERFVLDTNVVVQLLRWNDIGKHIGLVFECSGAPSS
jgi:hypothetical protein